MRFILQYWLIMASEEWQIWEGDLWGPSELPWAGRCPAIQRVLNAGYQFMSSKNGVHLWNEAIPIHSNKGNDGKMMGFALILGVSWGIPFSDPTSSEFVSHCCANNGGKDLRKNLAATVEISRWSDLNLLDFWWFLWAPKLGSGNLLKGDPPAWMAAFCLSLCDKQFVGTVCTSECVLSGIQTTIQHAHTETPTRTILYIYTLYITSLYILYTFATPFKSTFGVVICGPCCHEPDLEGWNTVYGLQASWDWPKFIGPQNGFWNAKER